MQNVAGGGEKHARVHAVARRLDRAGFTLIEVMVAFGLVGILSLIMATLFSQQARTVAFIRGQGSRDALVMHLRSYLLNMPKDDLIENQLLQNLAENSRPQNPNAPTGGSTGNDMLDYCYNSDPSPGCVSKLGGVNQLHELVLFSPILLPGVGADPARRAQTERLAGTTTDPVRYDLSGAHCPAGATASSSCPLEAVATFHAECPSGTDTCDQAASIVFHVTLRQAAGITLPEEMGLLSDVVIDSNLLTPAGLPSAGSQAIYVVHSQSTTFPDCPDSTWQKLWEGYSYLGSGAQDQLAGSSTQDLGSPGSCVEALTHPAFVECHDGGCEHGSGGDFSYYLWASGDNPSRCAVCAKTGKTVIARHGIGSPTCAIPTCPTGWTQLGVTGYSFMGTTGQAVAATANGSALVSQDLGSPGSCLTRWDELPFVECARTYSPGQCKHITGDDFAFWGHCGLSHTNSYSRCVVCESP
jgi:prepilin-type N-terminal cleavage/methylation domain-containing protein